MTDDVVECTVDKMDYKYANYQSITGGERTEMRG